jgi:hypothetical protein
MKKKIIFICCIFSFLIGVGFFFYERGVYEEVYDISDQPLIFNEDNRADDRSYEVFVTDTEIRFYDSSGNSIIYVFENDKLVNVFNVYNGENEVEARKIAAYFTSQIGNGEILNVKFLDNIVSVQMDMNCFAEYKDYTKKQFEEILLKDAKIVEEE